MAVLGKTLKLLLTVDALNDNRDPLGRVSVRVSVWASVSGRVNVNLSRYCRFTTIAAPVELAIEVPVIGLGLSPLTYVVQVSIL